MERIRRFRRHRCFARCVDLKILSPRRDGRLVEAVPGRPEGEWAKSTDLYRPRKGSAHTSSSKLSPGGAVCQSKVAVALAAPSCWPPAACPWLADLGCWRDEAVPLWRRRSEWCLLWLEPFFRRNDLNVNATNLQHQRRKGAFVPPTGPSFPSQHHSHSPLPSSPSRIPLSAGLEATNLFLFYYKTTSSRYILSVD